MKTWHILVPLFTSFTGWLVVRGMLWALFRPHQPKKLLGFTLHGIVPASKPAIVAAAGLKAEEIFAGFRLEDKIGDPGNVEKIRPVIETHVDHFLRVKLKEQMPMIGMFVGDKTINTLKQVFMTELETLFPVVMGQFGANLKNEINLEQMVVSKLNNIPIETVEKAFYDHYSRELKMASAFGAAIGLLIGIIELLVILLVK
jgi:hypothetical protein